MNIRANINRAANAVINAFSPTARARREVMREMAYFISKRAAGYNASKANRLNPWIPVKQNINDILRMERLPVSARVRHLIRNFPYFNNAAKRIADYVIGDGIKFQSRIKFSDGSLNRKLNQKIEDEIKWWMDEADVSGKLHFYDIQRLLNRTETETGDFVVVKINPKDRSKRFPYYALKVLDPDWLDSSLTSFPTAGTNTVIDQGIEYEAGTGKVLAYHFTDPGGWGKSMRVPSENVIHGFETNRAGQLRGISTLVAAVIVAADLGAYMGAHMDAAKMEAKWLGFVTKIDQSDMKTGFQQTSLFVNDSQLKDDEVYDEIENAIIEVLRPGENITFATPSRGKIGLTPFIKICLQMISVVSDVPYEILSADYEEVNFSTLNTSRRDFRHILKPKWGRNIRQMCRPLLIPLYDHIAMSGRVHMPGYSQNPYRYIQGVWQSPGMDPVDVLKEAKANAVDFMTGVNSPQQVAMERGRDYEEVIAQLSEAKKLAEQYGVTLNFSGVNTASQSNAAAVDEQSNKPEENEDGK